MPRLIRMLLDEEPCDDLADYLSQARRVNAALGWITDLLGVAVAKGITGAFGEQG